MIRRKQSVNSQSAFERFCSFDALYDASYKICRNVRWKDSTISFEEERLETTLQTEEELRDETYRQLLFSCFMIIERGKPRDIRACHIDDRLVHNALCDAVLTPDVAPKFIYDNCASQMNKGIDFALSRVGKHLKNAHQTYGLGKDFYGLRVDIAKYFDSIDHVALKQLLSEVIEDKKIVKLVSYIIDTFAYSPTKDKEPITSKQYYIGKHDNYVPWHGTRFKVGRKYYEYKEKSVGLGSQTSQFLALLALNKLDHYCKEQLHIKFYGRYMDDIYLLHNDKKYLLECKKKIEILLNEIGLQMNKKKTMIVRIHPTEGKKAHQAPFKYLKWNFYLTTTNKIIRIPFKKKLTKQRRKLRKMQALWLDKEMTTEEVQQSYSGWRASIKKGNTFYIVQKMDNYFRSLFKGVEIT